MIHLPGILHDDTVTILRTTSTGLPDDDGLPGEETTETEWAGVNVQQMKAEELEDHQQNSSTTYYRVAGPPPEVMIKETDRIRWRGTEYQIDGEPDARTGAYRINHVSLAMYRSRG